MAFDAGSVFVRLGALFQRDEFDKWDRAVDSERAKARDPISQKIDLDTSEFDRKLARVETEQKLFQRRVTSAGRVMWQDPHTQRFIPPPPVEAQRAAGLLPGGGGGGSFAGVRGKDNIGSPENPMVLTLEAGRLTPLGARAAGVAYGGENDVSKTTGPAPISGGVTTQPASNTNRIVPTKAENATPADQTIDVGIDQDKLNSSIVKAREKIAAFIADAGDDVKAKVDIDTTGAMLKIAAVKAALTSLGKDVHRGVFGPDITIPLGAMGGGDGGGGGAVPPEGGGGGGWASRLFGDAAYREMSGGGGGGNAATRWMFGGGGGGGGGGGRGFLGRFGAGGFNPFRYGIHGPLGAVGGAVGLGPEHLIGAAGAIGGSALQAGAGGGLLAAGAAGAMAVGGGSDLAVMKSTIADTQTLYKSYDTVAKAVARYGANSNQAKQAQAALNDQMKALGDTAGVKAEAGLARATHALNAYWDQATSPARVNAVKILDQVVKLGHDYVPKVAEAARQNLSIINEHIKPLFTWLEGPTGMGIFNHLESVFKRNLPDAVGAFVNGIKLMLRWISQASDFTGRFTKALNQHFQQWQKMPDQEIHDKIAHLVNIFRVWEKMLKDLGVDLFRLFHDGSGEGTELVQKFDDLLVRIGDWEKSARGSTAIKQFFKDRKDELLAILSIAGSVFKMFGAFYSALQPLVPVVTMFAREVAGGLAVLAKDVVQPLADVLKVVLTAFTRLGQESSIFKEAFIVPFGVFLIAWKAFGLSAAKNLFDIRAHIATVGRALEGASAAAKALFAGEGVGAAWQKLKDAMKVSKPDSPAAQMETAMATGGKKAAVSIEEAMTQGAERVRAAIEGGGTKAAGEMEAGTTKGGTTAAGEMEAGTAKGGTAAGGEIAGSEAAGGKVAGTEIAASEAAGGKVAGAEIAAEEAAGGVAGGAGGGLAAGAEGAAGASLLTRAGSRLGAVGRGALRAAPFIGTGLMAGQLYDHFTQTGNVLGRIGAGAGLGASAGAAAGAITGPGALISGAAGALAGGGAAALSALFGIGGPGKAEKELESFQKRVKAIQDPTQLSAQAIRKLQSEATNLARRMPDAAKGLNTLWHQLERLPASVAARQWNSAFNTAWKAVHNFTVQGGDSIKNMKDRFDTNMRLIAHTVGLNSDAGKKLAESNFNQMVTHVEGAMKRGKISVTDAMRFMRNEAAHGTKGMRDDLDGRYSEIVGIIQDRWKKGKISTQDALTEIRQITNDTNKHTRDDITNYYNQLLSDAKKSHDDGITTDAQYQKRRRDLYHAMANQIAGSEIKLSQSSAGILDGLHQATTTGLSQVFKELNGALKALNVSPVKWGVTTVSNAVAKGTQHLINMLPFKAGGGYLPGAEYGLDDNMILVDPRGVPRARMAGDELVFNRHQAPELNYALAFTKAMGAGQYGSVEEVWKGVSRPHGYSKGGKLKRYAGGGIVTASTFGGPGDPGTGSTGYRGDNLYAHPDSYAELNMGTALGSLPYLAPVDVTYSGKTARLFKRDIGAGGPGMGGHTRAIDLWFQAAQSLGVSGLANVLINGPAGVNVKVAGGAAGVGGGGSWSDIHAPHINGPGGPLNKLAQAAVDHATSAANKYGQAHAPAATGGGAAGTWGGGTVPGIASHPSGYFFPFPKGMSFSWNRIDQGQDLQERPGGPVVAIAPGVVSRASDRFGGFGPYYATEQISSGPLAGRGVYYGHTKVVKTGPVNAGDVIAVTQSAANSWTAAPAGWLELGFLPYGSMSAGNAMAPVLHAIYSGNYAGGGYLGKPTHGVLGSHKLAPEKPLKGAAHGVVPFGLSIEDLRRRGGMVGSMFALGGKLNIPGFARGGTSHPSLYTPPKPAKPKKTAVHKPPPMEKWIQDNVPGAAEMTNIDNQVARLEDQYGRQESLFNLYDQTLTMPELTTLWGIRQQEWDLLEPEYQKLPGIIQQIDRALTGYREPGHWNLPPKRHIDHWRTVGHGKQRHREWGHFETRVTNHRKHLVWIRDRHPGPDAKGPPAGARVPTWSPGLWHTGINQDVAHLTTQITNTQKEIDHLDNTLYKDKVAAARSRHGIQQAALAVAESLVGRVSKIIDQQMANTDHASAISDQIANIPPPQPLQPLGALHGEAYGNAQQGNAATTRDNQALQRLHHQLSAQRTKLIDSNNRLNDEIRKIYLQRQQANITLRQARLDVAWRYEEERLKIGEKVKLLKKKLADLKKKLADETKLQSDYDNALASMETRLAGYVDPNDPNATKASSSADTSGTSLLQEMGDLGFNIISLQQQGAPVPQKYIDMIKQVLTAKPFQFKKGANPPWATDPPWGLGLSLPPGFGVPGYVSAQAALEDFMTFQSERSNLFATFGSNFMPAGSAPFSADASAAAAGLQYYGAAGGEGSGVPAGTIGPGFARGGYLPNGQRGGDTIFNIEQHFNGAPDPHTYSAGLRHELGALV